MSRKSSIWIPPGATRFSCLCEACLELASGDGRTFLEAVRSANVRGRLPTESDVGFVHCAAGHEVVVRRVERPLRLPDRDTGQLQLV